MTHISNVTGYILPVEEVAALTDTEKMTVIVDGSQALGLIPVRLELMALITIYLRVIRHFTDRLESAVISHNLQEMQKN